MKFTHPIQISVLMLGLLCACSLTSANGIPGKALSGIELQELLPSIIAIGDNTTQTFEPDGSTHYIAGRPSIGFWRVEGDRYCSQWPPAQQWDCYDVYLDHNAEPNKLIWVDTSGHQTLNTIKPNTQ